MKRVCLSILCATLAACSYEDTGTITGAVAGGLLGSQVGGGTGKTVATMVGVMAGSKIGGRIGATMDEVNRMKANQAINQNPKSATTWTDKKTDQQYTIQPDSDVYEKKGRVCKDYTLSVTIDGKPEKASGVACRNRYGEWVIVN